jgi:hypothetical protein
VKAAAAPRSGRPLRSPGAAISGAVVAGAAVAGAVLLGTPAAHAHHGVASLGAVGLEGPGAPIETTISAALPDGQTLGYLKLDHASFETYTPERDDETDYNSYWLYGAGRGFTPWLTGYVFLPYTSKVVEDSSFTTSGVGDVALTGTVSFKYDGGFRLVPESESLDDWYDWHFSAYAGLTLPTGDANIRDAGGSIDPGQSLGFGEPSFLLGVATTRLLTDRQTLHLDLSYIYFQENRYDDGVNFQFGGESRFNAAWVYKLATNAAAASRWDLSVEGNYLALARDKTEGVCDVATGGDIFYVHPGVRYYKNNVSLALGVKVPVSAQLNEEDQQQGAEGGERYRLELTASVLF